MNRIGTRIIELLSLNPLKYNNQLHIRLTVNHNAVTFKWKVDSFTRDSLLDVASESEKKIKYRLSLKVYWDELEESYYSYITKITPYGSERYKFLCSETYAGNLNYFVTIETAEQLAALQPKKPTPSDPFAYEAKKEKVTRRFWTRIIATIIFIPAILSLLLLFSSHISSSTFVTGQAHSTSTSSIAYKTSPQIHPNKQISTPSEVVEVAMQSKYPTAKLTNLKTSSIHKGKVAITFDDGPSIYTEEIVDILKEHRIGATFFFLGINVKQYPELVAYVDKNGFQIGNHSYSHTSFMELSSDQMIKEISETNSLIKSVTSKPVTLFRPPYGRINKPIIELLDQQGLKTVLWDRDTRDWESRNAEQIYQSVVSTDASGAIYLFHETEATVEALPRIIKHLKSQNVEIVNLL